MLNVVTGNLKINETPQSDGNYKSLADIRLQIYINSVMISYIETNACLHPRRPRISITCTALVPHSPLYERNINQALTA